jgi:hypothetical protein
MLSVVKTMLDKIIFARVDETDFELLRKVCYARRENISSFVRRAMRMELARLNFLSDLDKKALGMVVQSGEGEKHG